MYTFKTVLLVESKLDESTLHPEYAHFHNDYQGAKHSIDMLGAVSDALRGQKRGLSVHRKYDGHDFVFGRHPESGRFFVARNTKTIRPLYTPEEVDGDPRMLSALKYLPKVAPPDGVYNGTLLYTIDQVKHDGKLFHFQPNMTKYTVHEASENGVKVAGSKMGIVLNSKRDGSDLASMDAEEEPDVNNFGTNSYVHVLDSSVDFAKQHYAPKLYNAVTKHAGEATDLATSMDFEHHDKHRETLLKYLVAADKDGSKPSTASYQKWLIDNKAASAANNVALLKSKFDQTFKLHHHLQNAKNALVEALTTYSPVSHSMDDGPVEKGDFSVFHRGKKFELTDLSHARKKSALVTSLKRKPNDSTKHTS